MPMKRATDLGIFRAAARSSRTGVVGDALSDGVLAVIVERLSPSKEISKTSAESAARLYPLAFVEVDVEILASAPSDWFVGKRINWRGGFSAAAIHRTLRALLAMGATFPEEDPTALDGVGSKEFRVRVVQVDCSDEETHGATGVKRFFIHEVLP